MGRGKKLVVEQLKHDGHIMRGNNAAFLNVTTQRLFVHVNRRD